jgi:hypothetical protein
MLLLIVHNVLQADVLMHHSTDSQILPPFHNHAPDLVELVCRNFMAWDTRNTF